MTQYKIQIGSWTKLPFGKVQEDTRDIMEMMADKVGGELEWYTATKGEQWRYFGVNDELIVKVYIKKTEYEDEELYSHPPLFIPYEELQRILNQKEVPTVTSLLNTKLDYRKPDGSVDEELSRAFQEACFEQGIIEGVAFNLPFLFVTEDRDFITWGDSEAYFDNHENKQINFKYSRTLTWEATEVPAKVEPITPEPTDEIVSICGVEYSAKELSEALALIKSARKG